ncbi:MAG: orotate phosphoribosyltransferase [Verrucomicrobia bacterium]|jgi:orotate phosphoribosyltransferase|nr:MAG: orotate phosphoribosyltransferase [Verrucomicrobiota bacterium]
MQHSTHSVDVKATTPKEQLLEILKEKSVCRGTFALASGRQSDFYVDAKLTTSEPRAALLVGSVGWELVKEIARARNVQVDSIGGLTMGADWMALSIGIAAYLDSPSRDIQTFSVRKSAKKHGRHKLIEGNFSAGDSVVIVDDVVTTGGSTLQAIDAIEASGGNVAFVIVLVDRQEGGREEIEKRGHKVVPIFTRADLVDRNAGRRSHIAIA